jgi:hypothetical protein
MSVIQFAGCAVLSAALLLLLRTLSPTLAPPVRAVALALLVGGALAFFHPVIGAMQELLSLAGGEAPAEVLLRATGVALVTELAAMLCRELGEGGIAEGVLLFGKLEILVLSLPFISAVLEIAKELLKF